MREKPAYDKDEALYSFDNLYMYSILVNSMTNSINKALSYFMKPESQRVEFASVQENVYESMASRPCTETWPWLSRGHTTGEVLRKPVGVTVRTTGSLLWSSWSHLGGLLITFTMKNDGLMSCF